MKKILLIILSATSIVCSSQTISVATLQEYIIKGTQPTNTEVKASYQADYRVIVWTVPLVKSYQYSDEVFDKLGYDREKSDYSNGVTYRNCSKGVLVDVRKYENGLSITMQWMSSSIRKQNKYFMFCISTNESSTTKKGGKDTMVVLTTQKTNATPSIEKSQEETTYKSDHWADTKGKGSFGAAMDNPTYENVEIIQTNKTIKVKLGTKVYNYIIMSAKHLPEGTYGKTVEYTVSLNGKQYILSIMYSKTGSAAGTYTIRIEKMWCVAEIKDVSTASKEAKQNIAERKQKIEVKLASDTIIYKRGTYSYQAIIDTSWGVYVDGILGNYSYKTVEIDTIPDKDFQNIFQMRTTTLTSYDDASDSITTLKCISNYPGCNLDDRKLLFSPSLGSIQYAKGQIIVLIEVDKDGNVTEAESGVTGTTIQDDSLFQKVKQASLKTKFDKSRNGTPFEYGTLQFRFPTP